MDAAGIDRRGRKINDSEGIACWPEVKETEYASFQKKRKFLQKERNYLLNQFLNFRFFY